jgi:hypothetical protein
MSSTTRRLDASWMFDRRGDAVLSPAKFLTKSDPIWCCASKSLHRCTGFVVRKLDATNWHRFPPPLFGVHQQPLPIPQEPCTPLPSLCEAIRSEQRREVRNPVLHYRLHWKPSDQSKRERVNELGADQVSESAMARSDL